MTDKEQKRVGAIKKMNVSIKERRNSNGMTKVTTAKYTRIETGEVRTKENSVAGSDDRILGVFETKVLEIAKIGGVMFDDGKEYSAVIIKDGWKKEQA